MNGVAVLTVPRFTGRADTSPTGEEVSDMEQNHLTERGRAGVFLFFSRDNMRSGRTGRLGPINQGQKLAFGLIQSACVLLHSGVDITSLQSGALDPEVHSSKSEQTNCGGTEQTEIVGKEP
ncbi:hypothetical protein ROHU_017472 [Labeo rohita]|uniref:Uncharacterized protein n=1 Tax=Labeo rohita TaxID=84645 RepID=A0A498LGK5_LABRO|nr:hypothetical protein ROHU_032442 [Labeo rohita]RXN30802.1 hypothetical protein ROHU_017472 [Labeo rohita]